MEIFEMTVIEFIPRKCREFEKPKTSDITQKISRLKSLNIFSLFPKQRKRYGNISAQEVKQINFEVQIAKIKISVKA